MFEVIRLSYCFKSDQNLQEPDDIILIVCCNSMPDLANALSDFDLLQTVFNLYIFTRRSKKVAFCTSCTS